MKQIVETPDTYIAVDLETTGFSSAKSHIIDIGAVKVVDNKIVSRFSALILPRPDYKVSSNIKRITGISTKMLNSEGLELRPVFEQFKSYIGDEVLVGYNFKSFDQHFLNRANQAFWGEDLNNKYCDLLYTARRQFPELDHHRLVDMLEVLDIHHEQQHRALPDCLDTVMINRKMELLRQN